MEPERVRLYASFIVLNSPTALARDGPAIEPLVPTPQSNICIHRTTLENKFRDEISE